MDSSRCITNTNWERYSNNTLHNAELSALEAHVKVCEICTDIKEGIDAMRHPELLKQEISSLNIRAANYLEQDKPRKAILFYWSAAAILFVSIGLSWFVITQKNNPLAEKPDAHDNIQNTDTPALIQRNKSDKLIASQLADSEAPNLKMPTNYRTSEKATTASENHDDVESYTSNATEDIGTDDVKNVKPQEETTTASGGVSTRSYDTTATDNVVVNTTETKALEEDASKDAVMLKKESITTVGTKRNNNGNPVVVTKKKANAAERSAKRTSVPSANNNTNADNNTSNYSNTLTLRAVDSADYALALKNFEGGNYDKALGNLYYITMNPNSAYYESGLMMKARIYYKQNKKEEARVALNTLIKLNREKRREAALLLDSIK